jgi:hypothetical protein
MPFLVVATRCRAHGSGGCVAHAFSYGFAINRQNPPLALSLPTGMFDKMHNPSYDFNDELIPLGATMRVRLAEAWLHQPQPAKCYCTDRSNIANVSSTLAR